jgi:hypothetical protein
MPLINGGQILPIVQSYRLVWIAGKFSGGKTSFSYYLAKQFLERENYRLVSNTKCIWNDELDQVQLCEDDMLHAVVVLDEGGQWFKSSKEIERVAAYAAKMDCIYIIPSFWPPNRAAQVVTIQPLFSFQSAGIPAIAYSWSVSLGAFKEKGWFVWLYPQELYGIYSRQDPGDSPEAIVSFLIERTTQFIQSKGRDHGLSTLETTSEADLIHEAANTMVQAADAIASVSVRSSKSRRK